MQYQGALIQNEKWATITTQEEKRQQGFIGDRFGLPAEPQLIVDKDCKPDIAII